MVIISGAGAAGCALRVLARDWLTLSGLRPWWGICAINLLGALAIGVIGGVVVSGGGRMDTPVSAMLVGLLAGWTTYSAFAMDVVQLWLRGEWRTGAVIWLATVFGAPLLALTGTALGTWLHGSGK